MVMVKKTCSSCHTRKTPKWRGDLCNRCHSRKKNGSNGEASSSGNDPPVKKQKRICDSCGVRKTSKWRGSICNKCYMRRRGKKAAMDDTATTTLTDKKLDAACFLIWCLFYLSCLERIVCKDYFLRCGEDGK